MAVYAFYEKLDRRKKKIVTRKSRDVREILTFRENVQDASRKLLGCVGNGQECFRVDAVQPSV